MADTITTRLRELMEEATPGPWRAGRPDMLSSAVYASGKVGPQGKYVYREPDVELKNVKAPAFHIPEPNSVADSQLIAELVTNLPTIIRLLEAGETAEGALEGALPYMEAAETAGLVGDEGCHWPVEAVREALATLRAAREGAR